jgi:hypothetical protein
MATISALRETLRSQLGDVSRITSEKRFDNQYLNEALFEAIQEHDSTLTWATLPQNQSQLVLILAKIRVSRDKALEYSLDTRVQVGSQFSGDKTAQAGLLLQVASSLQDEYDYQRGKIDGQESGTGDVIVSNLIRDSRLIHAKVPTQLAQRPPKPILMNVKYLYYANSSVYPPSDTGLQPYPCPFGRISFQWDRIDPGDLAYLRFYANTNPRAPLENWQVVRTIYDYYADTLAFERVSGPWISTGEAQMPKNELWVEWNLVPTGTWYFLLAAVNWNMLATLSDQTSITVENYVDLAADTVIIDSISLES